MKFRQIGLHVTNLTRALDFYSNIFNMTPIAVFDPPGFAFYNLGGVRLLLDINAPKSSIYLQVADVREEIERLRALGVEIIDEPHIVFPDSEAIFDESGNEWLAFIRDSEDNLIGLMSREISK